MADVCVWCVCVCACVWGLGVCLNARPIHFSPVTSSNVRISPKNFLTFSFPPFASMLKTFKVIPSASPKTSNLNQDYPSVKWVFLIKFLYQTLVL